MQKIMFEHRRFGLEQAVIARLKENTRRRVRFPKGINDADVESDVMGIDEKGRVYFTFSVATDQVTESVDVYPKYQIGEKVAIAQSYASLLCGWGALSKRTDNGCITVKALDNVDITVGDFVIDGTKIPMEYDGVGIQAIHTKKKILDNKMFVRADLMPHVIEITDIKAERLQDISDDDCLREGIHVHNPDPSEPCFIGYAYDATPGTKRKRWWFHTPRKAFAALIEALNGRGTWNRNEWQFAYTFKLIK